MMGDEGLYAAEYQPPPPFFDPFVIAGLVSLILVIYSHFK